jgi:hypothetical protein
MPISELGRLEMAHRDAVKKAIKNTSTHPPCDDTGRVYTGYKRYRYCDCEVGQTLKALERAKKSFDRPRPERPDDV